MNSISPRALAGRVLSSVAIAVVAGFAVGLLLGESLRSTAFIVLGVAVGVVIYEIAVAFWSGPN